MIVYDDFHGGETGAGTGADIKQQSQKKLMVHSDHQVISLIIVNVLKCFDDKLL